MDTSSNYKSHPVTDQDRTVAIVAPQWLQDGLAVVVKSIPGLQLVACTGSINTLFLLDLEHSPDLVVFTLDTADSKASIPIRQIKFIYPQARCLALIQDPAQSDSAVATGADETLLQGASARQFCAAVRRQIGGGQIDRGGKQQDD